MLVTTTQTKPRGGDRGGRRPKGLNQKPKSFRIDLDLNEKLVKIKNSNRFINDAIREKLNTLNTI